MTQTEKIYTISVPKNICISRVQDLMKQYGYTVKDHSITTYTDSTCNGHCNALKSSQIFLNDIAIGGLDDLKTHLETKSPHHHRTYRPVIALFLRAALYSIIMTWFVKSTFFSVQTFPWFIAISMMCLGIQKIPNIKKFALMFATYDLLAKRWMSYGYIYPFIEIGAGFMMLLGAFTWISAPIIIVTAGIGTVSVFKATILDTRDLKCACVGGNSQVPLGYVSLLENIVMLGMAVWMLIQM